MIAVIDYGAGNLQSVCKAFAHLGADVMVAATAAELMSADAAVLPGVGAFGEAMKNMVHADLISPVQDFIASGKPFLGVCLGMQLLFSESEEAPGVAGLGVCKGKLLRLPAAQGLKIPHIGWNSLALTQRGGLFSGLPPEPYVYFVHSYYLKAEEPSVVSARAEYGVTLDAAVAFKNVHATQFHPEKSGETGLQMLRNFMQML